MGSISKLRLKLWKHRLSLYNLRLNFYNLSLSLQILATMVGIGRGLAEIERDWGGIV